MVPISSGTLFKRTTLIGQIARTPPITGLEVLITSGTLFKTELVLGILAIENLPGITIIETVLRSCGESGIMIPSLLLNYNLP